MESERSGDRRAVAAEISNRRRSPRIPVSGRITCEMVALHVSVTLVNISAGGFFVRSPIKCAVGDVQRFQFTVDGEHRAIFVLRGRAVHCVPVVIDDTTAYLMGFEFVEPIFQHAIAHLIDVLNR
ncbi:MAG TPA: PilZ domain-containing protein [Vicinamibacterales bacterium]